MIEQTIAHQTSHTAGILLRLEQNLAKAKRDLSSATHNLIVGGTMLLIGLIALLVYFLLSIDCAIVIAVIGLLIGGAMVILALVKTRAAHHLIDTLTDQIVDAQAELDGLNAQLPAAE
ncbi:MAG: hypothetical protein JXA14_01035 [Anaerolineae bacterium]|nr:hypothetical protein [Anaerolineae bacterium]